MTLPLLLPYSVPYAACQPLYCLYCLPMQAPVMTHARASAQPTSPTCPLLTSCPHPSH